MVLAGSAKRKEIFLETAVNEDKELLELLTTSDADNQGLEEYVRAIQEGDRKRTVPEYQLCLLCLQSTSQS